MFKEAVIFATKKHKGQKRRVSGEPYIIHPIRVATLLTDPKHKIIAVLHDVIEDTNTTLDEINHFGKEVVEAVNALTRRDKETNEEYILRVKQNKNATAVKIMDMVDNLSDHPSEKCIKKCANALDLLINV